MTQPFLHQTRLRNSLCAIIMGFALVLPFSFRAQAQSSTQSRGSCLLTIPTQLTISNVTGCSTSLSWKPVTGASYYKVKYKVHTSSKWIVLTKVTGNSYTYTNLTGSTLYDFGVGAFCSNNATSGWATISSSTVSCGPPVIDTISVYDPQKIYISWDGCSSSHNQIRYKFWNTGTWTYVNTGTASNINLQNLVTNAKYVFQVCSCSDTTGNWSATDTFVMKARPNILLIVVDDARYDSYSCNGAPSWFQSPNIDRIANEGINIKDAAAVYSFCAPSRGSIVTGLYPHNNGAIDNSSNIYPWLPTTATILDSAGYYVGWVGKYHLAIPPQPGYNYWIGAKMNSGTSEYWNLQYDCNGTLKVVPGHDTQTVTDSSLGFFNHVHYQNFFLTVAYHAPHAPCEPQPQYLGRFKSDSMPFPSNTAHYLTNYPSFLYILPPRYYIDSDSIAPTYESYYEMMAGVDSGIGLIFNRIQQMGEFDNTLIIFTSDNGLMIGEHGLYTKLLGYEPSIKIPFFMRYPAWFSPGTISTGFTALNIDIAPTILQAAGINTPYHFDGVSITKLLDGEVSRPQMYYEYLHNNVKNIPSIRAVRDSNYVLIDYLCNSNTQEFFNIKSDPGELSNLINNNLFVQKISTYNTLLNNLKTQYNDTYKDPIISCNLSNQTHRSFEDDDEDNYLHPEIFPNPASDIVTIGYFHNAVDESGTLRITNAMGEVCFQRPTTLNHGDNEDDIDVSKFSNGIYYAWITGAHQQFTLPFLVSH